MTTQTKFQRQKAARHERLLADPTIVEHGMASTYTGYGCRCPHCRAAYAISKSPRTAPYTPDEFMGKLITLAHYAPDNTVRDVLDRLIEDLS